MRIYDLSYVYTWLLNYLYVQLFVTLCALPILIAWGLPISIMTIVGNLIFTPFIILFLICSSLIFFTELLYIPNTLFIVCLEWLYTIWIWCISWNSTTWLYGFRMLPSVVLMSIPFIAYCVVCSMRYKAIGYKVVALATVLAACIMYGLYNNCYGPTLLEIPCGKGTITVLHTRNYTMLIDRGYTSAIASASSWVQYTLVPTLIKNYGNPVIDSYICMRPGIRSFQVAQASASALYVRSLYIPYWTGSASSSMLRSYYALKNVLRLKNIQLLRIAPQSTITINKAITITAHNTLRSSMQLKYPLLTIVIKYDKKELKIEARG